MGHLQNPGNPLKNQRFFSVKTSPVESLDVRQRIRAAKDVRGNGLTLKSWGDFTENSFLMGISMVISMDLTNKNGGFEWRLHRKHWGFVW